MRNSPESRSHISLAAVAALATAMAGAAGCGKGSPDEEMLSSTERQALATAERIKPNGEARIVKLVDDYHAAVGDICSELIGEDAQGGSVTYRTDPIEAGGAIIGSKSRPEGAVACSVGSSLDEADGNAAAIAVGRLAQEHKNSGVGGNFEFCVQTPPERAMFETSDVRAFVSAVTVKLGSCEELATAKAAGLIKDVGSPAAAAAGFFQVGNAPNVTFGPSAEPIRTVAPGQNIDSTPKSPATGGSRNGGFNGTSWTK